MLRALANELSKRSLPVLQKMGMTIATLHGGLQKGAFRWSWRQVAIVSTRETSWLAWWPWSLGPERTFKLVRNWFYWACIRCTWGKTLRSRSISIDHLQSQGPMVLVCIDFFCLDPTSSGQEHFLVVKTISPIMPSCFQQNTKQKKPWWRRSLFTMDCPN